MEKRVVLALVVVMALFVAGCGGDEPTPTLGSGPGDESSRSARTLPVPGQEMTEGRPQAGTAAGTLAWSVPAGWIEEEPATPMRNYQYRLPGGNGDGECIVFYFGPGEGGDPMSNARRWAGQFVQPDGSSSLEVMKVTTLDSTSVPVQMVEVTGTYDGGMTMTAQPAEARPGHMLLGGIAQGPDGPWFFKVTGPEATIREQRAAFVGMMESIRVEG